MAGRSAQLELWARLRRLGVRAEARPLATGRPATAQLASGLSRGPRRRLSSSVKATRPPGTRIASRLSRAVGRPLPQGLGEFPILKIQSTDSPGDVKRTTALTSAETMPIHRSTAVGASAASPAALRRRLTEATTSIAGPTAPQPTTVRATPRAILKPMTRTSKPTAGKPPPPKARQLIKETPTIRTGRRLKAVPFRRAVRASVGSPVATEG